jgi:CheY-like chemotaxis protein
VPQFTVLVIDDDPSILDFLDVALTEEGYRVLTAVDSDALRVAHKFHPNVILLDLQMPVMDGAEISRHLRADAATAHIPIIVMSAKDGLDTTAQTIPVDDQLAKPFPLRVLYDVVARWC